MPERMFENETVLGNAAETRVRVSHPNWGAIWGGVFSFYAIWLIFGMLGVAVFASAANPGAAHPVTGMNVGESAWLIILTIVSFYVAGRATGHLAGIGNRRDGAVHGMAMFGLSTVGLLLLMVVEQAITPGAIAAANPHNPGILGWFAAIGWATFVALFLGWIAALIGSATAARSMGVSVQQQARRAA